MHIKPSTCHCIWGASQRCPPLTQRFTQSIAPCSCVVSTEQHEQRSNVPIWSSQGGCRSVVARAALQPTDQGTACMNEYNPNVCQVLTWIVPCRSVSLYHRQRTPPQYHTRYTGNAHMSQACPVHTAEHGWKLTAQVPTLPLKRQVSTQPGSLRALAQLMLWYRPSSHAGAKLAPQTKTQGSKCHRPLSLQLLHKAAELMADAL